MKPANYYASTVSIPGYVETDIASLDFDQVLSAIHCLTEASHDREFPLDLAGFGTFANETLNWLTAQSVATYKDLLKWIASELL